MIFSIKFPVDAVVAVNVVLKEVDVDAVVVAHIFVNKLAGAAAVNVVLNEVAVAVVLVFHDFLNKVSCRCCGCC